MDNLTRKFLVDAFIDRLKIVNLILVGRVEKYEECTFGTDSDYEEIMRSLMVKYFPKIKQKILPISELDLYFDLLLNLHPACRLEDLRFLDIYNNAFEVLINFTKAQNHRLYYSFLYQYKRALQIHIHKLFS